MSLQDVQSDAARRSCKTGQGAALRALHRSDEATVT